MLWLFMLVALPWDLFSQVLFGQTYALANEADLVVAMLSNFSGFQEAVPTAGRRLLHDDGDNYNGDDDATVNGSIGADDIWRSVVHTIMTMLLLWVILALASCITPCVVLCCYKQKVHDKREPLTPIDINAIQKDDSDQATDLLDMEFKLFGCCEDMDVCLHGTFCQICRVADTWGTAKVFEFCCGAIVFLLASQVCIVVFFVLFAMASPLFPEEEKAVDADLEQWLSERNATEEANQAVRDIMSLNGGTKQQQVPIGVTLLMYFFGFVGFVVQSGVLGLLRTQLRQKLGGEKDYKVLFKDALIWGFCPCCATIQEARVVDKLNGVRVVCCLKLEQADSYQLVGEVTAVAR